MERSSPTGSPRLPVHANTNPPQPADQISAAKDEGQPGPFCLQGSQGNQSPTEDQQSPNEEHQSPKEEHQSPTEDQQSPTEEHQSPTEDQQSPNEEHQSPTEEHQSPTEEHQSPTEEHQSPAEEHQSPAEEPQSPAEEHQSPAEDLQNPLDDHQSPKVDHQSLLEDHLSVSEEHQRPSEDCQTPAKDHWSPAEDHQSLKVDNQNLLEDQQSLSEDPLEEHQSPAQDHCSPTGNDQSLEEDHQSPTEEPDQLSVSKHNKQKDTSPEKQKSEDSSETYQLKPDLSCLSLDPLSTEQQELGDSSPTIEAEDSFLKHQPKPDPLNPVSVSSDQIKPGDSSQELKPVVSQERKIQKEASPPTSPAAPSSPLTDQVWSCLPVSQEPKLCGFLQKQAGPLKAWKQRWFTYEEKKNQLFYYRTQQDVTPLGWVELCGATFSYPLQVERGIFHINTPERTFILKAVTHELMLYWLQQLQGKRWQHRQTSTCSQQSHNNNNNNNTTDEFLPALKSPLGLVGEEAASGPAPRTPFPNLSIKHPIIEIQNSVHSLRKKSSQEGSQSTFHLEATPIASPETVSPVTEPPPSNLPMEPLTPPTPLPSTETAPPPPSSSAEPASESPVVDRKWRASWILRRESASSETIRLQRDKDTLMEEVKAQKELVWILHKALEASQREKRSCAEFLSAPSEQQRLELLRHSERVATDLRGQVEVAKAELDTTRRSLSERDAQVCSLQEQIRRLTERNHAKQEVIIKLADQVTSCLSAPPVPPVEDQTVRRLKQKVEQLKDDLEAYQTQNKFLNSEILQLTQIWRRSSEQERGLMMKCAHLEAGLCQVESRYLVVLRTLQESKALEPGPRAAVQKMITDALRGGAAKREKITADRDHDEYGFKIIPDYEVEDVKLLAKIQALEIRSQNLHQEAGQRPLLARWAQYLAGRSDRDLIPSPELKALLRGGIPLEYRPRVWSWIIRTRTNSIRETHPQRYLQLCEKSRTSPHPASRQIQLDLHRTLTSNQHFSSPSSPALQQLQRILLAFTWQNPTIGYCQGLNRLAAIALLVLQSEEEAFWCLVAVVETIMPQDYYTKNLVASQADQRVLKDFLLEKLPRLASHFEAHGVDVSLITFNWFLVVFVESLPSDILLPLWDAFLYEGTKVMFRYALALFKYKEDDILKIHDSVEIYRYLRFFTMTICDSRRLCNVAFSDMNPFPGRLLRSRRALHLERLQGELQELEQQQKEFLTESVQRKDKELHTGVSEDDDDL